jgi:ergothioneine biosynthesis protein EgtB
MRGRAAFRGAPSRRHALAAQLAAARRQSDALFALVRPHALLARPIPERNRILFYLGHLEAFDWNLLCRDSLGLEAFHSDFDRLFAFGIDPVGGALPDDPPSAWPPLEEVRRYNARARQAVDEALSRISLERPPHPNLQDGWALHLAIEHRLMHAETLAYMLHRLPYASKRPGPVPDADDACPASRLVEVPRGRATLGLERRAHPTLGWDNEYEAQSVEVDAFAIESRNVTCGDYLRFVREAGYRERSLWSAEGWEWIRAAGIEHPASWVRRGEAWLYRGMFAESPLGLSRPVYVSHAEAEAYARWAGRSLPSEAQFHRAAYGTPQGTERAFPWGNDAPGPAHGVFGFSAWDPEPAGSHPAGDSAYGVSDLVGNGWEWTRTLFEPFPGFEPLPFYRGYSADFFDGRHYVLKGASARTDHALLRRSFRNWFQPRYPHVYAGFRCVEPRA